MLAVNSLRNLSRASGLAVALLLGNVAQAGLNITVEAPGVQASTQSGTLVVETFNSLGVGTYTLINSPVGTYTSPGAAVVAANAFGGANQTNYIAVGNQSNPTTTMTLTLHQPNPYFGLYWGAMDNLNSLEVYNGASLLATITRATLSSLMTNVGPPNGTGHFGNPNTNQNTTEQYAFVNLFATGGDAITKLVFNNPQGTGFETDNHTLIPEPSSVLIWLGIGLVGYSRVRTRRENG